MTPLQSTPLNSPRMPTSTPSEAFGHTLKHYELNGFKTNPSDANDKPKSSFCDCFSRKKVKHARELTEAEIDFTIHEKGKKINIEGKK